MLLVCASVAAWAAHAHVWAQSRAVPQGSPLPRIVVPPVAPSTPGAVPVFPTLADTDVPDRPVRVSSVEVQGATAFPNAALAGYTNGLIASDTRIPAVEAARLAILRHYRSRGFVLTTVSVKLDGAGHLRFVVTEGYISRVKLDGDIGPAGVQVLRFLDRLTEERPIAAATLERYLLLAQDVPGVTLRSVLEPSNDEPGAMTLIAQVSRRAFSGLISADNRAYHQTGPNEALTALDLNSFTEFGEKTEFSFYHTFPNSQNFGQISSEFLVGSSGLKVKIYAGHGVVNPTGALGRTGYQGLTTVFGTQASYPVIRSRQQTLTLYGGLDAMEATVFTGTPSTRASFDSLRVIRLGEDYVLSDIWFGTDYSALNTVSVRASEGLRLLGASTTGTAFSSARQHERSDFTKVNFEVGRTQTLFAPWDGASVALMVLATGQWSDNILPPAEQFYLGGSRFTRGYYSGQVPGDKALAATAELQLNTSFGVPFVRTDTDIAAQFYVFYDWGQTWQNQSADYATKVASAGGGTRLQLTSYAELDVEALARLNVYPGGGQNQGVSALNSIGLYWRILGHF